MRVVFSFFGLCSIVGGSKPIVYPIVIESLHKCSVSTLCRPQRRYDNEELDYIKQLKITDLAFYDVFSKAEIFMWFKPVKKRKHVPFYIWNGATNMKETAFNTPVWFMDLWASFYNDALQSSWRTMNSTAAVLHYYAGPLRPKEADLLVKVVAERSYELEVVRSEEFVTANGSNFFLVPSTWQVLGSATRVSQHFFDAIAKSEKPDLERVNRFRNVVPSLHYGLFPFVTPCATLTHYTAFDASRALRFWPHGLLESYKYPLGRWQQMLQNRKIKWLFNGQIDYRPAYDDRRLLLKRNVTSLCDDGGIISRIDEGPESIPECSAHRLVNGRAPSLCQCFERHRIRTIGFEDTLLHTLFAFHIRGDDYYSSRIADILGAGAVPLIVDYTMMLGMSGQCHSPVKDMAVWIPRDEWVKDPAKAAMDAVNRKSHNDMEKLVRLLEYYRDSLLSGVYGDNRVIEDRLSHMALRCLNEDLLATMGFTKADMTCDFEDGANTPTFRSTGDLDDAEVPWGDTILPGKLV
eukprot:Blabericola_migrator_1__3024@NODE_187_length_11743_cov_250_942275_g162_i0_p2_GENE_NODE_187_length_11743_cov_250_942275_g162_i0NODE_187_length_11743_cov_250_942275_g162_i0_p2_ORF_typecomplete_len520_score65_79Exostosin/PF03016_15/1_1e06_NODE_187_length_11743_cov_250_942275_g162_i050726631